MSKILRIQEFAKLVGRTPQTIRRWEKEGKLVAKRLPSGHRYFLESDVQIVRDIPFASEPVDRRTVVYCRVSSASQKKDLASQVRAMETFCLGAGIAVDDWIQEIGGGMNFKRKKFLELLDAVLQGKVKRCYRCSQGPLDAVRLRSVRTFGDRARLQDHRGQPGESFSSAGNGGGPDGDRACIQLSFVRIEEVPQAVSRGIPKCGTR